VAFKFNCRITFYNKHLKDEMLYLLLTEHIQSTLSQVNNCSVLIVYRVTIHNKFSNLPPPESVHSWTRLDHGLSHPLRGPGEVANSLTGIKNALAKRLHVQLELNTLRMEVGRKWGPCSWSSYTYPFVMIGVMEYILRKLFADIY
jgi:hypothetical protein